MSEFLIAKYDWIKALHVIFMIAWMAGMFYLPRLFVYHTKAKKGSELSETLKIMERKLLRIIINPAMILSWIFGVEMLSLRPDLLSAKWMHVKLTMLILMQLFHALLSHWRRDFFRDKNRHSEIFYRRVNEVPTVLMIVIVIMVIIKPF